MRVKEGGGFAVFNQDGIPRAYASGQLVLPDDPIVRSHGHMLEPAETGIEQATASPGERRRLRLPKGNTVKGATEANPNGRNQSVAPHALDPSDPASPASTFATAQPAAGVVADDVPDEQNPAGGPKASDAGNIGGVDEEKVPTSQGKDAPGSGQTPQEGAKKAQAEQSKGDK